MRRRASSRLKATAAILVAVLLGGCAGPQARIAKSELEAAIREGTAPTIIDVRSRSEYEAGHLPGAIHLPFYSTWSSNAVLPAAKDTPVVVYCEHGPRAGLARLGLESLGYEQVISLEGHMAAWRAAGLPLETGPE
jgi:rhodanese-related sulfurtransferase